MKLYSKEVLLLGGIYEILAIPLAYLPSEVANIVTDILFGIFIICIIMLFFNKIPKFITFVQNSFPKISYYLTAIGGIPYAIMFFSSSSLEAILLSIIQMNKLTSSCMFSIRNFAIVFNIPYCGVFQI